MYKDCLVFVECLTFNHSKFIKEALEGFAKQSTTFPFACVVIDDHSTDGTSEAIQDWMNCECDTSSIQHYDQEFLDLYVCKHKTNQNCTFAFYLLKMNLNGDKRKNNLIEVWRKNAKYEALCEGDDYWTDPNKLQAQIDILESHGQYSASTTNALVLRTSSEKLFGPQGNKDFYKIEDIIGKRQFHTATVVFRTAAMLNSPYYGKGDWDTFMWCSLLTQGPIHYEGKVTCVYRKQGQGMTESTPKINWAIMLSKWADILIECYVPQYVQRRHVVRSVTKEILIFYFLYGNKLSSDDRKTLRALYLHNFSIWNILYDVQKMMILCVKTLIRK